MQVTYFFLSFHHKAHMSMKKLQTIWLLLRRHKYLLTTLIFLLIIGVLDENSLIRRAVHRQEMASLKAEIKRYTLQYEEDTRRLEELNNNPEAIEKIARERYLMKTEDEDIFIFEE